MNFKSLLFSFVLLIFTVTGCKHTSVSEQQIITGLDRVEVGVADRVEGWDGINNLYRDGSFYFSGQPDESSFRQLVEKEGIKTIISLRRPSEMTDLGFDQQVLLEGLGVNYINLPFDTGTYSTINVDQFADVLASSEGSLLVHCGSSNRVGVLWASYLLRYRGFEFDEAVARGKAAGMTRDSLIELIHRIEQ